MPGAMSGSPPVTMTCRVGKSPSRSRMASMVIGSPSGRQEVYSESHQTQRSGQPVVRTKADGTPIKRPSPWIEKKMSEIFMYYPPSAIGYPLLYLADSGQ